MNLPDEYDDAPWAWLGYALGLVAVLLVAGGVVAAGLLLAGLL